MSVVNPRRACAARVTLVVVSVCLCVCLCVCPLSHNHLTSGAFVRCENAATHSAGNEGQKICGVFSETAPLPRSSGPSLDGQLFSLAKLLPVTQFDSYCPFHPSWEALIYVTQLRCPMSSTQLRRRFLHHFLSLLSNSLQHTLPMFRSSSRPKLLTLYLVMSQQHLTLLLSRSNCRTHFARVLSLPRRKGHQVGFLYH